jgi:hypothetical protein
MLLLESHRTVTFRRAVRAATLYVEALTKIAVALGEYADAMTKLANVYVKAISPGNGEK